MKWNTTRLNQPFTWYSGDVIEKIKKEALKEVHECEDMYGVDCCFDDSECSRDCYATRIIQIIENEDK